MARDGNFFNSPGVSQVAQSLHVASDLVARLLGGSAAKYFTVGMIVSAFGSLQLPAWSTLPHKQFLVDASFTPRPPR
jgi:hypothetical protein